MVPTKNGIRTVVDVVIVDPTRVDYFLDLAQFKDLLPPMQFKPMKGVITIDTPLINSFFEQLRYLVVYTNMSMYFYMIVPMPFGA